MTATTFTVHARLPEEHGTTHCVDVAATDTVKIVLEKVAGELGVDPGDVALYHDGVAHLEEKVTGTTLGEGSEVEARLSKEEVARRTLQVGGERERTAWGGDWRGGRLLEGDGLADGSGCRGGA